MSDIVNKWEMNRDFKEWELNTLTDSELMRLEVRVIDNLNIRLSDEHGWVGRDEDDIHRASENLKLIEKVKGEKK